MKGVYYGWWIVAVAMFINVIVLGASFATFGLYVLPVSAEFHLSRADMNTALILMNIGNGVMAPILGRILDRVPIRRVMMLSALLFAASFAALSLSHSLWLSALVLLLGVPTAFLGGGILSIPILIARWFQAHRGRAMSLAGLGMILASMVMPLIVGPLIQSLGWRTTLMILGVGVGAILLPCTLLLRERPGPDDVEPGLKGASTPHRRVAEGPPARLAEILRSATFWLVTLGVTIGQGVSQALIVSLIPLARENGMSMMEASSILSAVGVGGVVGLLAVAAIADRLDRILLLTGLLVLLGLMSGALLFNTSYPLLLAVAVFKGAAAGVLTPMLAAVLADRFGAASLGTVRGLTVPLTSIMSVIALRFAGEVYDRTGGYDLMFQVFLVIALAAAAMVFAMRFTKASAGRNEVLEPAA